MGDVIGAVVITVLLVVVFPVTIFASGAAGSALLGKFLKDDADQRHEGSELLELNR